MGSWQFEARNLSRAEPSVVLKADPGVSGRETSKKPEVRRQARVVIDLDVVSFCHLIQGADIEQTTIARYRDVLDARQAIEPLQRKQPVVGQSQVFERAHPREAFERFELRVSHENQRAYVAQPRQRR